LNFENVGYLRVSVTSQELAYFSAIVSHSLILSYTGVRAA